MALLGADLMRGGDDRVVSRLPHDRIEMGAPLVVEGRAFRLAA
jgi:hypothetical protein